MGDNKRGDEKRGINPYDHDLHRAIANCIIDNHKSLGIYICTICGNDVVITENKTESKEHEFNCALKHVLTHVEHVEDPRRHCPLCDFVTYTDSELEQHMDEHENQPAPAHAHAPVPAPQHVLAQMLVQLHQTQQLGRIVGQMIDQMQVPQLFNGANFAHGLEDDQGDGDDMPPLEDPDEIPPLVDDSGQVHYQYRCPIPGCNYGCQTEAFLGYHILTHGYEGLSMLDGKKKIYGFPGIDKLVGLGMLQRIMPCEKLEMNSCSICVDDYSEKKLPLMMSCCKQNICSWCIEQHLSNKPHPICPYCRWKKFPKLPVVKKVKEESK